MIPTRTVLFVNYTPNSELAKRLREALADMEAILGFRVRVVEKTGTPLRLLFSPSKLWEGMHCGRGETECITCNQGGEDPPPCMKRSLVYENVCLLCHPKAEKKGDYKPEGEAYHPSIYVGETSRSIAERTTQHWKGYKEKK